MAIAPITLGDTNARLKINAAIEKANLVDSKADTTDLADAIEEESNTRAESIAALATSLEDEANTRSASVAALSQSIQDESLTRSGQDGLRVQYHQAGYICSRPGESGKFFTSDIDGAPSAVTAISDSLKVLTADGMVARLPGESRLAPVAVFKVEPGHRYRARFVFRRSTDSEDPANDAVRLGLRWLTNAKAGLATEALVDLLDLRAADGRLEYSFVFSTVDGDDAAAPAGAVYVRPFVRTFSLGVTDVEIIEVTDLTLAADYSPDLSVYRNEIAGLQQQVADALARIETLESI
jgi:hypothetical protein